MVNVKFQGYLQRKSQGFDYQSQIEGKFSLGSLIKWVSIQNSSKNPKGPIETYKKNWDFLGYFKVDSWAPIGPKEVENTNRRNYLMGNSQKNSKNFNSLIEA